MNNCDKNISYVDILATVATLCNTLVTTTCSFTTGWRSLRTTPTMTFILGIVLLVEVVVGGITPATGLARPVTMHTAIGTRCLEASSSRRRV
jgi:hypothetical protein